MTMQEYGTKVSATGNNAGGRASQSQATPEMGVKQMPNPEVPASPFNPSSKGKVNPNRPPSPMSPRGLGYPNWPEPPSPMSPRGLGYPAPLQPAKNPVGPGANTKVPAPRTSGK